MTVNVGREEAKDIDQYVAMGKAHKMKMSPREDKSQDSADEKKFKSV
jgi:hypothetical protein